MVSLYETRAHGKREQCDQRAPPFCSARIPSDIPAVWRLGAVAGKVSGLMKPPWFKIDPAQFLCDAQVDAMSTVELGACFRLMCRQWIDGFIPDDAHLLARLCRLDAPAMGEAWVTLSQFYPVVSDAKRANRYMWIEREKVTAELEKKSDEGTRAAHKRWGEVRKQRDAAPNGSPMPEPMQEEIRLEENKTSSSEPKTGSGGKVAPSRN